MIFAIGLKAQIIIPASEFKNLQNHPNAQVVQGMVQGSDTILIVKHAPIVIMPERKFKNNRELAHYKRLIYNLKKIYPYSVLIRKVYRQLADSSAKITDEHQRKAFMKEQENILRAQFEGQLKKLTITQGRLLIKLVDRETSHTTYEVIKEFRGDMSAFLWQGLARLFGSNLKSEYDPNEEDKMIEEIIHMIENGML